MTVEEFIDYVNQDKSKWIYYCEILIDREGLVILARPSHQEAAIKYIQKRYNYTREEIYDIIPIDCDVTSFISEKEELIFVWYDYIIGNINDKQQETINILRKNKLISDCIKVHFAKEYTWHINRGLN